MNKLTSEEIEEYSRYFHPAATVVNKLPDPATMKGKDLVEVLIPNSTGTHDKYQLIKGAWQNMNASGIPGPVGPAGTNGTNGTNGVGVPTGGTTGQVLAKNSNTDFDTHWINESGGTDSNAIHKNVAAEISTITEKTTPASGDLIIIEDSADSNNKKKVQIGNLPGGGSGAHNYTPNANTRLYLHMDNYATDASGNGLNGVQTNITWVTGKKGQAASFNGSTSKIDLRPEILTGNNLNYTISMWIKLTNNSQSGKVLIELMDAVTGVSIIFDYVSSSIFFRRVRQGQADNNVSTSLSDTSGWHHLAGTYDGTYLKLYLDGTYIGSTEASSVGNAQDMWRYSVGYTTNGANYFNGIIDELIIEDKTWSSTDVTNYYNATV